MKEKIKEIFSSLYSNTKSRFMKLPKLIIFLSGFILITLFSVLFYVYFSGKGNDIEKIEEDDIEKYAVFPTNLTCLVLKESIPIEDALSATANIITLFKKLYIIYSNSFYALSRAEDKKREDEKSVVISHKGDYFDVFGIFKEIPEKSYISIYFRPAYQKIIFLGGMRIGVSSVFEDFLISERRVFEKMNYYVSGSVNATIDLSSGKMKIITRNGKFAVQVIGKEYGINYSLISSFISQKDGKMEMEVKGEYIENNGVCYPFNLKSKFNITFDVFTFIFVMRDLCYLSSDFSDFVLNDFTIWSDGEVIKVRRKGMEKGVKEGESEGEEIFYCYEIF